MSSNHLLSSIPIAQPGGSVDCRPRTHESNDKSRPRRNPNARSCQSPETISQRSGMRHGSTMLIAGAASPMANHTCERH